MYAARPGVRLVPPHDRLDRTRGLAHQPVEERGDLGRHRLRPRGVEEPARVLEVLGLVPGQAGVLGDRLGQVRACDRDGAQHDGPAVEQQADVRLRVAHVHDYTRALESVPGAGEVAERRAFDVDDARIHAGAAERRQVLRQVRARGEHGQRVGLTLARFHVLVDQHRVEDGEGQRLFDLEGQGLLDALGADEREAHVPLCNPVRRIGRNNELVREPVLVQEAAERVFTLCRRRVAFEPVFQDAQQLDRTQAGSQLGELRRPRSDVDPDNAAPDQRHRCP